MRLVLLLLSFATAASADSVSLYSQVQWFGNPDIIPRIVETSGGPITSNVVTPGLITTGGATINEGILDIGIPFTMSISNCFTCAFSLVYLELNRPGGFGYFYEAGIEYVDQFKHHDHDRNHDRLDINSVLSFEFAGLRPGIYDFDAGAVNFFDKDEHKDLIQTPEPTTLGLLVVVSVLTLLKYAYSFNRSWWNKRRTQSVS